MNFILFARVIDYYGDAAIAWRLSRLLVQKLRDKKNEVAPKVILVIDCLDTLQALVPSVDVLARYQVIDGVEIHHWTLDIEDRLILPEKISEQIWCVIEIIECDAPKKKLLQLHKNAARFIYLHYHYLATEQWAPDYHLRLASVTIEKEHLKRINFFPGFEPNLGGLLNEHQSKPQVLPKFISDLVCQKNQLQALLISIFTYPDTPYQKLFSAWRKSSRAIICVIPDCILPASFLKQFATDRLIFVSLPFLPQIDYDLLLTQCDLNFVRGEDSFMQAAWSGKAYIWQAYRQDHDAHWDKINAHLAQLEKFGEQHYLPIPRQLLTLFSLWNHSSTSTHSSNNSDWNVMWQNCLVDWPNTSIFFKAWSEKLQQQESVVDYLMKAVIEDRTAIMAHQ